MPINIYEALERLDRKVKMNIEQQDKTLSKEEREFWKKVQKKHSRLAKLETQAVNSQQMIVGKKYNTFT